MFILFRVNTRKAKSIMYNFRFIHLIYKIISIRFLLLHYKIRNKRFFSLSFDCILWNESFMLEKMLCKKKNIISVNIECEYLNEFTEWGLDVYLYLGLICLNQQMLCIQITTFKNNSFSFNIILAHRWIQKKNHFIPAHIHFK